MFKNISFLQILFCITIALFSSSVGFFTGVYDEQNKHKNLEIISSVLESTTENSCKIPVISINQIENGILNISKFNSENNSEIRIIVNNDDKTLQVLDTKNQNINIDVVTIFPKTEKIPAPAWAKFVASKRGTTFWPLDHPRAFILTPKNRIFFRNKADAFEKNYKYGVK